MPYAQRDGENKVIGLFANPQPNATELLADDHPDVVAFLTPAPNLQQTIKDMVGQMDPVVLLRYPGDTSLIGLFLNEGNLPGAAGLLTALAAKIQTDGDTEAMAALQPVLELFS